MRFTASNPIIIKDYPTRSRTGATFSHCQNYRYSLWRIWNVVDNPKMACLILLNPSTADATKNDPTIERCSRRFKKLGYDGIYVVNIFAFRATDPKVMKNQDDPFGPKNEEAILECAKASDLVVCGWGTHGDWRNRSSHISELLRRNGILAKCLGKTKSGQPKHPLYISYETELVDWP